MIKRTLALLCLFSLLPLNLVQADNNPVPVTAQAQCTGPIVNGYCVATPSSGGGGGGGNVVVTQSALPMNAAQESGGNLAATATATGTTADTAYAGSGNATVVGILKGIFAQVKAAATSLAGTLTTSVSNATALGRAVAGSSNPVVVSAWPSKFSEIVPANTTAVVIKGSAGTLGNLQYFNINALPLWAKFYDATSGTCGSGTVVARFMIPAASTPANGAGGVIPLGNGVTFGTGITMCITVGIADNDTTTPTAANTTINADYE